MFWTRFGFQQKRKLPLGVCLDGDQIYFAEMEKRGNRYRVKSASVPIPSGAVVDGWPKNASSLEEVLRELGQRYGWQRKSVVASLGAKQAIIRHLTLPLMPGQDLRKAVAWEAEKYLPLNKQDYSLDYQPLGRETGEGKNIEVLLAALPKELAWEYWSIFQKAGFKLEAIDVVPLAQKRSLGNCRQDYDKNKPVLLLNLGNEFCTMTIIHQGRISFTRTLSFGAKSPGSSSLPNLINEVARSLDYYRLEHRSLPPDQAIVSGPLSGWPISILECLEQQLNLITEIALPDQSLPVNQEPGPEFIVAMGLALWEEKDGNMSINLLPEELRGKPASYRSWLLPGLILIGLLLAVTSIIFLYSETIRLENQHRELETVLVELKSELTLEKKREESLAQLEREKLALLSVLSRGDFSRSLKNISESIHPHLRLLSISI
ncbi:MAG TPA: pilus assembly protein PilM, partial [Clostridia bacterium]|nr:pilus assembly protein PilM [Clostridia bacterium]